VTPPRRRAAAAAARETPALPRSALCVYAVTASASRIARRGPAGEQIETIAAGRCAAVVGPVSRRPQPSPENLRRFDAVIRMLWTQVPAVLPARFGTCAGGADELREALTSRERPLVRDLRRVRGRAQMTVRVLPGGAAPDDPVASGATRHMEPPVTAQASGSPQSGADHLRRLAAQAASDRHVPGFAPLRHAVRRWLREERVEKHAAVISVYHLVPRGSVDAYRRAIERAAAGSGLRVAITGPHPPYAFA